MQEREARVNWQHTYQYMLTLTLISALDSGTRAVGSACRFFLAHGNLRIRSCLSRYYVAHLIC